MIIPITLPDPAEEPSVIYVEDGPDGRKTFLSFGHDAFERLGRFLRAQEVQPQPNPKEK